MFTEVLFFNFKNMLDVLILQPCEKTFKHTGVLNNKALAWEIDKACAETFQEIGEKIKGLPILSSRVGEVLQGAIESGQAQIQELYENWKQLIASNNN